MSRELWIVGGPNGAGKTTWVRSALGDQAGGLYLGADQIAAELRPGEPEAVAIPAGREFLRRLRAKIENGDDLTVETTLSGKGMARYLKLARQHDYRIALVFIFVHQADVCVARVRSRVRQGGHHVPESDILRRYARSVRNFSDLYRQLADEWHLYINGRNGFEMLAAGESSVSIVINQARFRFFSEVRRSAQ